MKSTAHRTTAGTSGRSASSVKPQHHRRSRVTFASVVAVATASLFVAFVALSVSTLGVGQSASAATPQSVTQCNGTDAGNPNFAAYATGGAGITCAITVENEFNLATGTTSSTLTLKECVGAADANTACDTSVTPSSTLIGSIDQCAGVGNAGGSKIVCSIDIVNNIVGGAPAGAATVNQCIGSGAGAIFPTVDCTPGGNTTNATVTQCNGSGNGLTLVRLECSSDATISASLPYSITQCNGTGNGGGAYVDCEVTVTNVITAADSGSPSGSPTGTGVPTDSPTSTPTDTPTSTPTDTPTSTPTDTPTSTPTDTPTSTPTDTPTSTPTDTPTSTPTDTPTSTPTDTPTSTPTDTPTSTPTDTPTSTPTDTPTSTPTETPTSTPSATPTPTETAGGGTGAGSGTGTGTGGVIVTTTTTSTATETASASAAAAGAGGSGGGSATGGTGSLAETGMVLAPTIGIAGGILLFGILALTAVTALRRRNSQRP